MNTFQILFLIFMFIFVLSGIFSFLFRKNQLFANTFTNVINSLNSLFGIILSLFFLITNQPATPIISTSSSFSLFKLALSIDPVSAYFLLVLCVLAFAVSVYSVSYMKHYHGKYDLGRFGLLISLFIFSMIAVFTSSGLIMFYISWEIMAVVSFFLVAFEHENEDARSSSLLYIVMTHVGAAFILLGFVIIYSINGSFDMVSVSNAPASLRLILLILFFIGFGMKAGLVPLHIWLPYAHPAAPANVSALMSGVMLKTAFYGMFRFCIEIVGCDFPSFGTAVVAAGILSVAIGAVYMYVEPDFKRMLAYSSIENMGIITIAFGLFCIGTSTHNPELSVLSYIAMLIHIFSHMLFKGLMFMIAGSVHYATDTRDLEKLGGLIKIMPLTGLLVVLGGLSMSAIVPLNGFIGEWVIIQSLFNAVLTADPVSKMIIVLAVASFGFAGAFACASAVRVIGIGFLGKPRSENALNAKEVPFFMSAPMTLFGVMCLLTGIFPMSLVILATSTFMPAFQGVSDLTTLFIPISFSENTIHPLTAFLGIAAIMFAMFIISLMRRNKFKTEYYETWNCGYDKSTAKMQYSSTGYSNPVSTVFNIIFKADEDIQIKKGSNPYSVKNITLTKTNRKLFESVFYNPMKRFTLLVSNVSKNKIQAGSTETYLAYIFVFLLLLLILNKFI